MAKSLVGPSVFRTASWKARRLARVVPLVLLVSACGGASKSGSGESQTAAGAGSQSPGRAAASADVAALFDRELEPLPKLPIAAPDGQWKATIEARSAPKVHRAEGVTTVEADLGVGAPLTCAVHDGAVDPGGTVALVVQNARKTVEIKQIGPYAVERLGAYPALFVRAVYHAKVDGQLRAGDLKLMVSSRDRRSLVCSLDAPGYASTFVRATSDLARSFEPKPAPPKQGRVDVWKLRMEAMPVGQNRFSVAPAGNGRSKISEVSSTVMPVSAGEVQTSDEYNEASIDEQARIVEGVWVRSHNGEVDCQIELKRDGKGYTYKGTFNGKPLHGRIASAKVVNATVSLEPVAARVAKSGKVETVELDEYHPSMDPTAVTRVKYELAPSPDGATIRAYLGATVLRLEADRSGVVRRLSMPAGGREIVGEVMDERGRP